LPDLWGFMPIAEFNGTQTLPNGQKCNYWVTYSGDGKQRGDISLKTNNKR